MKDRIHAMGRAASIGLTTLLLAALPLTAQSAGEGGTATMNAHAEIGTLAGIDFDSERIVTLLTADEGEASVRRTYRTGATTLVEGLGGIMDVGEITNNMYGNVVVVEFVRGEADELPFARRIQFPDAREIHVTHGTIVSVDRDDRVLTLIDARGLHEMSVDIGHGATIDSARGLLELDDLNRGQDVTVYYADFEDATNRRTDEVGVAYLLFQSS